MHVVLLLFLDLKKEKEKGVTSAALDSAETHQTISHLFGLGDFFFFTHLFLFAAGPGDEMDNCGLCSDSVSHSSTKEHETIQKKEKSPREQLFTPSLCSFVPPLPSAAPGASQRSFHWLLLCQGANRFHSQV